MRHRLTLKGVGFCLEIFKILIVCTVLLVCLADTRTLRQPNVNLQEMMFCDVEISGYQYHPCGFYDGDYRWGKGFILNC